jgi:signal peptidase I
MSTQKKSRKEKHPWRENIEAIAMAIVVALLFKSFVLEISKIPSGSMQPTLMGSPETSVFDRILVDKVSYQFRDPERFEIVVFKHPLERSRVMVKRLVGMPGEELEIRHGDLWTRPDASAPWRVLRRPPDVQEAMWKRIDPVRPERSSWGVVDGGERWSLLSSAVRALGDGRIRFHPEWDSIRDRYTDGYPDSLRADIGGPGERGKHAVGDLRLEGRVRAQAGLQELVILLGEGERAYEFRLPGPAASDGAVPEIRVRRGSDVAASAAAAEPWRLRPSEALRIAAENLDDRLALEVDGRTVATLEIEPSERQESAVEIEVRGDGADLDELVVSRDVFYFWPDAESPGRPAGGAWRVAIPPEHYVMLGDNTQDSADSRDWKAITYSWSEDGEPHAERGNYRHGADQPNPVEFGLAGAPWVSFRDEWGDLHGFPRSAARSEDHGNAPLVPRELVLGRAFAVFWPLKPSRKLWRLGWLR